MEEGDQQIAEVIRHSRGAAWRQTIRIVVKARVCLLNVPHPSAIVYGYAFEAERETALLQRQLDDVRRMPFPPKAPEGPAMRKSRAALGHLGKGIAGPPQLANFLRVQPE
jgi:hypothetical protein